MKFLSVRTYFLVLTSLSFFGKKMCKVIQTWEIHQTKNSTSGKYISILSKSLQVMFTDGRFQNMYVGITSLQR